MARAGDHGQAQRRAVEGAVEGVRPARFDAVGDDAFRRLVLARVIEPTSKADSRRVLEEIGVEHASPAPNWSGMFRRT